MMTRSIGILIIEDDRELHAKITTLIRERFGFECVIVQGDKEQLKRGNENFIGHMSGLDLLQALLNEPLQCPVSSFDLILKGACTIGKISSSQPYRVPTNKFAGVRNNPVPKRCRNAKRKSWYG